MDLFLTSIIDSSSSSSEGIQRCPFLRNINQPTNFSFAPSSLSFPNPVRGAAKGPIFEDGPNFDMAFRLFHGRDGVVPLSGKSHDDDLKPPVPAFNPLAAKAATISLSGFSGAFFGFDFFLSKSKKLNSNKKQSNRDPNLKKKGGNSSHEAMSNEWLETGQCPIAKSYRAVSSVLPLVAKALQPPPGLKLRCPHAVVAARAALARTALVKNLRPQPLPDKMLAIALLGMAANVPLGIWREHTDKFSPQWFAAVHAAVPFIAMLRKSVLMPKAAMVFTIAASILGQTIGSRAERLRLKKAAERRNTSAAAAMMSGKDAAMIMPLEKGSSHCSDGEARPWNPLAIEEGGTSSSAATSTKASVCY